MRNAFCELAVLTAATLAGTVAAAAWDYAGHRVVNQLALASLPSDFPRFVKDPATAERIAFLSGEPDRWRNAQDLSFNHVNKPDHYIDIEELKVYGLHPEDLPIFRYDFEGQLAIAHKENPSKFPAADPAFNKDHTRQLVGLLPWTIAENYAKLKSSCSYLKAFQENNGTPEEIANAQENIVYVMGVMGHYVGDASQPLHTTIYFNGWVGNNPHAYTTNHSFHAWIDGGFFAKAGGPDVKALQARLRPARLVAIDGREAKPEEMFHAGLLFILEQNKLVEALYQLEKDGKLTGEGEKGVEGRGFLEGQLLKAAQLLGDIWYSAWQQAPPDMYLARELAHRQETRPNGAVSTDHAQTK